MQHSGRKEHRAQGSTLGVMTCECCGKTLAMEKFEHMRTGTYRRICHHCQYERYIKPYRMRKILREMEEEKEKIADRLSY